MLEFFANTYQFLSDILTGKQKNKIKSGLNISDEQYFTNCYLITDINLTLREPKTVDSFIKMHIDKTNYRNLHFEFHTLLIYIILEKYP